MQKFTLINEAVRQRAAAAMYDVPDGWVVTISKPTKKRTDPQNALYWKWIDLIRIHIGDSSGQWYSKDQMHEYFKAKFQPTEVVEIAGEQRPVPKSTTKNTTVEMGEYMDKVSRYCATSLCLFLPHPGDEAYA